MDYVWLILAIALIPASQVFFKAGILRVGQSPQQLGKLPRFLLKAVFNRFVICGIVLQLLSVIAMGSAISIFALSYFFPLSQAIPIVLVAVFSLVLFREKISRMSWLGIVIICVGVALLKTAMD